MTPGDEHDRNGDQALVRFTLAALRIAGPEPRWKRDPGMISRTTRSRY